MVTIKVNKERRNNLEKLHTATHILNFAAQKVLGNHIWQHGSNLKENNGSLDITHYKQLTQEEVFQIESVVQELINKGEEIFIEELERTKAEQKYGFRLYQGGAIPQRKLRIVHVGNFDIEACGGLHVGNSKDISLFKIVSTSKLQDGVIRVEFRVDSHAFEFIQEQQKELYNTAQELSVNWKDVAKSAAKFFNSWKNLKKQTEQMQGSIKKIYSERIKELPDAKNIEIHNELPIKDLQELFEEGRQERSTFTIISPEFILSTQDSISDYKYKKKIKRGDMYQYIR